MWLWGANPWAYSSDLPTPGDSRPTVLARRHWSRHQALGASCQTTADGGLPSSHRPEVLAQSSHRRQKKKKKDSYEYDLGLCIELSPSGWVTSWPFCMGKTDIGGYMPTFQPFFFTPAMLIGPIVLTSSILYHFHWPWPCWRSQDQCKAKPFGFITLHTFQLIRMKFHFVVNWSSSGWSSRYYVWVRFNETGNNCCFKDCVKKKLTLACIWMSVNSWLKLGLMVDTIVFYILIVVLLTLTLIQGHRRARKQKHLQQLSHKVFSLLFRILRVMDLILTLPCPFNI